MTDGRLACVTGAAGFIGSHLSERLLAEGYRVLGIDSFTDFYARAAKERNLAAARAHPAFHFVEGVLLTLDLFGHAGKRQATLAEALLAFLRDDLRVDEHAQIARLVLAGDVDHEQAQALADLRRRQAHAGRGVHGLGHVLDQLADAVVDRGDGLGFLAQPRIGVVEDGANGHGSTCKNAAQLEG